MKPYDDDDDDNDNDNDDYDDNFSKKFFSRLFTKAPCCMVQDVCV